MLTPFNDIPSSVHEHLVVALKSILDLRGGDSQCQIIQSSNDLGGLGLWEVLEFRKDLLLQVYEVVVEPFPHEELSNAVHSVLLDLDNSLSEVILVLDSFSVDSFV